MISIMNYVLLVLAALTCFGLYNISYETQHAADELKSLKRQISAERNRIAELEADWAVLNRLQGLQVRSTRYLQLQPVNGGQVMTLDKALAELPGPGQNDAPLPAAPVIEAPSGDEPDLQVPVPKQMAEAADTPAQDMPVLTTANTLPGQAATQ